MAERYNIHVLMLTECSIEPDELLANLNQIGKPRYQYAPGYACEKVKIFTKFSPDFIKPVHEADRLTIRHLDLPRCKDILLAVTHFPSKFDWSDASQSMECQELAASIRSVEQEVGHSRTVLVGDLNMNPFEAGVVGAAGLHAVMTRHIAEKKSRVVQEKEYPFFYNPMWNFFGDQTPYPPGTHYFTDSEQIVFFWNMYDQVLVRPDLLGMFSTEDLAILDRDGDISFLNANGIPNPTVASDHLPLLFRLQL